MSERIVLQWMEERAGVIRSVMTHAGKEIAFVIRFPKNKRTWYALERTSLKQPVRCGTLDQAKKQAQSFADELQS